MSWNSILFLPYKRYSRYKLQQGLNLWTRGCWHCWMHNFLQQGRGCAGKFCSYKFYWLSVSDNTKWKHTELWHCATRDYFILTAKPVSLLSYRKLAAISLCKWKAPFVNDKFAMLLWPDFSFFSVPPMGEYNQNITQGDKNFDSSHAGVRKPSSSPSL